MALPRCHRLRQRDRFPALYRGGRKLSTPSLLFRWLPQPESSASSRFAIVVSLKVHKRAVRRNLLRRRLQAALLQLRDRLRPGFDGLLTVKTGIDLNTSTAEFLQELEDLLTRAEIIHGRQ
ncbi:ribonuclease P protein component [Synechococcus elongatus]|uniref:ribonuclease P protein component n=1 Tax=Synechococcus elongatus TaxID=32046 RepID=UPI0030D625BF